MSQDCSNRGYSMRDSSQHGVSFLKAAGVVFAAVGVCTVLIYWGTQLWHYKEVSETTKIMGAFFEKYRTGVADLAKEKANIMGPLALKNHNLLDQCEQTVSMFSNQKAVCKLPLGEFDVTANYEEFHLYTYVYVHFNDIYKRQSCKQFLMAGWQDILPTNFWGEYGYIGVISENTKGEMFFSNDKRTPQQGTDVKIRSAQADAVCNVCRNSRYCTIQFFFDYPESVENVTFPAKFVGENEKDGEITREGNTFTKTNGDFQEVVTYQDGGIFSGATFSGGALSSVYRGTYTPRGITSYTSYTNVNNEKTINKIDNITYDQNGKIESYEKDSQKFLLMGDATDCLILDNTSNTKKLGDCSTPFQNEISFVILNYDERGLLSEISSEGGENSLYKFIYDPLSGKLIGYCDKVNKDCHNVVDGQTVKDILKHDVPETIGKFNSLYKELKEPTETKPERKKHRILTREEALKYVKEKDNKVQLKFK